MCDFYIPNSIIDKLKASASGSEINLTINILPKMSEEEKDKLVDEIAKKLNECRFPR
jgi:hypothetical protein